jgi:putative transposase
MRFEFIAKHRGAWPVSWICEALGVSRSGFHAWLVRAPSARARSDEEFGAKVRASFISSYRTYGARRVWHDLLAEGLSCGLHRIERLMRVHGLKARPRRRGLPKDDGLRSVIADNVLDRQFTADAPNQRWIADFTYILHAKRGGRRRRRSGSSASDRRFLDHHDCPVCDGRTLQAIKSRIRMGVRSWEVGNRSRSSVCGS